MHNSQKLPFYDELLIAFYYPMLTRKYNIFKARTRQSASRKSKVKVIKTLCFPKRVYNIEKVYCATLLCFCCTKKNCRVLFWWCEKAKVLALIPYILGLCFITSRLFVQNAFDMSQKLYDDVAFGVYVTNYFRNCMCFSQILPEFTFAGIYKIIN